MTASRIVRARSLRERGTFVERKLWAALRGGALGVRFRRQHPVGRYVVDFACVPARLSVELDGRVHELRVLEDLQRSAEIEALGWSILRISNEQVDADLGGVLELIRSRL